VSKGEQTREAILRQSAEVFNRQGYAGASLSDIMRATGLEKGGIYNHFGSKDQLALEAFDYAFGLVSERLRQALEGKRHAIDRLQAMIDTIGAQAEGEPVAGGCPILNTAIEADDTHPALRARARSAMDSWTGFIQRTLSRGIERGEVRPNIDIAEVATLMIATLEGAIMMSKLYGDPVYIHRAAAYLTQYLERELRP
jgi:TetR/AcrR family transcriptional regulator, transcriptional repressor for nem operon